MTETEKAYQQKVQARAQTLNAELEQSSKFAELRGMHFRAFLNMRAWWHFWKTPARLFQLAHHCAALDFLTRVDEAQGIALQLGEKGIDTPKIARILSGTPSVTPVQLSLAVETEH